MLTYPRRESFYRNHIISQNALAAISDSSSRTIMIGQNDEARAFVTCVNILSSSTPGKIVIGVDFAGCKVVAKYWPVELVRMNHLSI